MADEPKKSDGPKGQAQPVTQPAPQTGWTKNLSDTMARIMAKDIPPGLGIEWKGSQPMRFDTQGRTAPAQESWTTNPAGQALAGGGPAGAGAIKGVKLAGREGLNQAKQIFTGGKQGIILPEDPYLQRLFSNMTSWFHGTKVEPKLIEKSGGLRISAEPPIVGEPSGVSLTPRLEIANQFGQQGIYRVHPQVHPEEVFRFYDPKHLEEYRKFLPEAIGPLDKVPMSVPRGSKQFQEWIKTHQPAGSEGYAEAVRLSSEIPPEARKAIADNINRALTDRGFAAMLYHPQRYGEFELRHLVPERAKLIERRKAGEQFGSNPPPNQGPFFPLSRFSQAQEQPWDNAMPQLQDRIGVSKELDQAIRTRYSLPPDVPVQQRNQAVMDWIQSPASKKLQDTLAELQKKFGGQLWANP